MLKIATWNVNSVKARLPRVLDWLAEAAPDVALLQEIKSIEETFPALEIRELGYNVAVAGQKTYNGVAILSKLPIEITLDALPGDGDDDAPDPTTTSVAIALGLGTVLARGVSTSSAISLRTRVTLLLCAYACSLGLAMLGTFVAITRGQPQVGLMFALAAGIFALRRPGTLGANGSGTT